MSEDYVKQMF